ncbi:hypothetical protein J6590_036569 [Homalodisca vitripennis]|nr:hypothetical protein J6590_036569 [Homalodisca vitripennis]
MCIVSNDPGYVRELLPVGLTRQILTSKQYPILKAKWMFSLNGRFDSLILPVGDRCERNKYARILNSPEALIAVLKPLAPAGLDMYGTVIAPEALIAVLKPLTPQGWTCSCNST